MAYVRKTQDEFILLGNYGFGFEELTSEESHKEIRARLKEYRENEGGNYKIQKKRIKINLK